jgi:hypothetical protein
MEPLPSRPRPLRLSLGTLMILIAIAAVDLGTLVSIVQREAGPRPYIWCVGVFIAFWFDLWVFSLIHGLRDVLRKARAAGSSTLERVIAVLVFVTAGGIPIGILVRILTRPR